MPSSPEHPFNLNVSYTVIKHGFHQSFTEGFRTIWGEAKNIVSRGREVLVPGKPFPDFTYDIVNGRLHWPGDEKPVEYHYRANISWLMTNGGSEEQISHAKLELAGLLEIQPRVLNLQDKQSVMWMSQKTMDPTKGIALHQIRKEGNKLIQSSQLLPFDQQSQIDTFINKLSNGREVASVSDDVGGWIVQGQAVDFDRGFPETISEVMTPEFQGVNWQELTMIELPQLSDRVVSVEPTSFWWQILAAKATEMSNTIVRSIGVEDGFQEVQEQEFMVPALMTPAIKTPSGSHLEGPIELVELKPTVKEVSSRLDFVGTDHVEPVVERGPEQVPTKTVFVAPRTIEQVIREKETQILHIVVPQRHDGLTKISVAIDVPESKAPSRMNPVGLKTTESKAVVSVVKKGAKKVVTRLHIDTISAQTVVFKRVPARIIPAGQKSESFLPPEWQVKLEPLNDKEIPFWQPSLDSFANDDALIFIVVTTFFLIANTTWRRRAQTFVDVRGSGEPQLRAAVAFS